MAEVDKFISGLPTGTIDSISAAVALETGMPTGTNTIQSSLAQISQIMAQSGYLTGSYTPMNGYISENGAQLSYITGTSYRVEAGAAHVNGLLLSWASPITRTSVTIVSGTMNYIYVYASGTNTAALEESTTVPVWDGTLNYWKKTGDNTRRCLGYLQGQNANVLRKFTNVVYGRVSSFYYTDGLADTPKVPVNQVSSTGSWANVSLASIIPYNANEVYLIAKLILGTSGDDGTIGISPIDLGSASAAVAIQQVRVRASANAANTFFGVAWMPISEPQTIYYKVLPNSGTPLAQIVIEGTRIIR